MIMMMTMMCSSSFGITHCQPLRTWVYYSLVQNNMTDQYTYASSCRFHDCSCQWGKETEAKAMDLAHFSDVCLPALVTTRTTFKTMIFHTSIPAQRPSPLTHPYRPPTSTKAMLCCCLLSSSEWAFSHLLTHLSSFERCVFHILQPPQRPELGEITTVGELNGQEGALVLHLT
jgi:hypothetical protein